MTVYKQFKSFSQIERKSKKMLNEDSFNKKNYNEEAIVVKWILTHNTQTSFSVQRKCCKF